MKTLAKLKFDYYSVVFWLARFLPQRKRIALKEYALRGMFLAAKTLFLTTMLLAQACVAFEPAPIYAYCKLNQLGEKVLIEELDSGDERSQVCSECVELGDGKAECR